MVTYTSTGGTFNVRVQAEDYTSGGGTPTFGAYRRSKTEMVLYRNTTGVVIYVVAMGNKSQAYYSDGNGKLVIPIKGWVENLSVVTSMGVSVRTTSAPDTIVDYITMLVIVSDGVDYDDNPAPIEKGVNEWTWTRRHDAVLPPNVMYSPTGGTGVIAEANMHLANSQGVSASKVVGGTQTAINPTGERFSQLIVDETVDILRFSDKSVAHDWVFDRGGDCLDMAVVRWFSLTGAWRKHYFPVVGYLKNGEDQTSLVTSSDGYLSVRDATLGVRCRIDGLTPYSLWYYADLLQASEVHASLNVAETLLTDDVTAANVEESEASIGLVNGFYPFEFTLKMKQYDKV